MNEPAYWQGPGDEPACWSWEIPALSYEGELARLQEEDELSAGAAELVLYNWDRHVWSMFHEDRCAICGIRPVDLRRVDDHCHKTGMIRGLLCRSCNVREGRSGEDVFIRYRRIHPAQILDVYLPYSGMNWVNGWHIGDCPGDPYVLGPRPATPWEPWTKDIPLDRGLQQD